MKNKKSIRRLNGKLFIRTDKKQLRRIQKQLKTIKKRTKVSQKKTSNADLIEQALEKFINN